MYLIYNIGMARSVPESSNNDSASSLSAVVSQTLPSGGSSPNESSRSSIRSPPPLVRRGFDDGNFFAPLTNDAETSSDADTQARGSTSEDEEVIYRPGDRRRRPRYRNSLRTAILLDDDSLARMTDDTEIQIVSSSDDDAEHDPPEIPPFPLMRSSQVARDFPDLRARSLPDGILPANIDRPPSVVPPSQADTDEYISSSSQDGNSSDDTWVPDSNDEMEQTD